MLCAWLDQSSLLSLSLSQSADMQKSLSVPSPWPMPQRTEADSTRNPPLVMPTTPPLSPDAASSAVGSNFALPPTPQSSLTSLTCATPISSHPQGESTRVRMSPEILAVGELLSTMKQMVGVLGTTLDCLGEQTVKVAELPPAIESMVEVSVISVFSQVFPTVVKSNLSGVGSAPRIVPPMFPPRSSHYRTRRTA